MVVYQYCLSVDRLFISYSGFADYIANGLFSESGFITNYHKQ